MRTWVNIYQTSYSYLTTEKDPSCWSAITTEVFSKTKARIKPDYVQALKSQYSLEKQKTIGIFAKTLDAK